MAATEMRHALLGLHTNAERTVNCINRVSFFQESEMTKSWVLFLFTQYKGAFAHSAKWLSNANDAARGDSSAHYVNDELDSLVRCFSSIQTKPQFTRLTFFLSKSGFWIHFNCSMSSHLNSDVDAKVKEEISAHD